MKKLIITLLIIFPVLCNAHDISDLESEIIAYFKYKSHISFTLCKISDREYEYEQALKYKQDAISYAQEALELCGECEIKEEIKKALREYREYKPSKI